MPCTRARAAHRGQRRSGELPRLCRGVAAQGVEAYHDNDRRTSCGCGPGASTRSPAAVTRPRRVSSARSRPSGAGGVQYRIDIQARRGQRQADIYRIRPSGAMTPERGRSGTATSTSTSATESTTTTLTKRALVAKRAYSKGPDVEAEAMPFTPVANGRGADGVASKRLGFSPVARTRPASGAGCELA
jgi:hypothetical protein